MPLFAKGWARTLSVVILMTVNGGSAGAAAKGCDAVRAVLEEAGDAGVLIVGEWHRDPSAHRFFGDLLAALLVRGERVRIGLEIPRDRQRLLTEMLSGRREADAVVPPVIDSPSYRRLLDRLRHFRSAYPGRIRVLALDAPGGAGGDRDRAMAAALMRDLDHGHRERTVVLAGNLHALRRWPGGGRTPLAARLAARSDSILSLLQVPSSRLGPGRAPEPGYYPAGEEGAAAGMERLISCLPRAAAHPNRPHEYATFTDGVLLWP